MTEHQIHRLQCPDCGHRCRGQLPATVPRGSFGPGVVSVVTLLSGFGLLSQRMISGIHQVLFRLKMADGQAVCRASDAKVSGWDTTTLFAVRLSRSRKKFIICWTQLLRDSQAVIDHAGVAVEIGKRIKEPGAGTGTFRRVGRRPFDCSSDAVKATFNTKPAPKLIPRN